MSPLATRRNACPNSPLILISRSALVPAFRPRAHRLGGRGHMEKLWDRKTATVLKSWPVASASKLAGLCVAFSPMATSGLFQRERERENLEHNHFPGSAKPAFESARPCSAWLQPGRPSLRYRHGDGFVRVWDLERTLLEIARALGPSHRLCAFSHNSGEHLAAASSDRSVQVWTMQDLSRAPVHFQAHDGLVVGLALVPITGAWLRRTRPTSALGSDTGRQVLTFRGFTK